MCHWSHFQIELSPVGALFPTILIIPKDFLPFYCYNYGYFLHCGIIIFFLFLFCFLFYFFLFFSLISLLLLFLLLQRELVWLEIAPPLWLANNTEISDSLSCSHISSERFKTSLWKSGQFVTYKVDFSNTTGKQSGSHFFICGELVGMPLMQKKDTLKSWKSQFW